MFAYFVYSGRLRLKEFSMYAMAKFIYKIRGIEFNPGIEMFLQLINKFKNKNKNETHFGIRLHKIITINKANFITSQLLS